MSDILKTKILIMVSSHFYSFIINLNNTISEFIINEKNFFFIL